MRGVRSRMVACLAVAAWLFHACNSSPTERQSTAVKAGDAQAKCEAKGGVPLAAGECVSSVTAPELASAPPPPPPPPKKDPTVLPEPSAPVLASTLRTQATCEAANLIWKNSRCMEIEESSCYDDKLKWSSAFAWSKSITPPRCLSVAESACATDFQGDPDTGTCFTETSCLAAERRWLANRCLTKAESDCLDKQLQLNPETGACFSVTQLHDRCRLTSPGSLWDGTGCSSSSSSSDHNAMCTKYHGAGWIYDAAATSVDKCKEASPLEQKCIGAGKTLVGDRCQIDGFACPAGWTPTGETITTPATGRGGSTSGCQAGQKTCTTLFHATLGTEVEKCEAGHNLACGPSITGVKSFYATVVAVGCRCSDAAKCADTVAAGCYWHQPNLLTWLPVLGGTVSEADCKARDNCEDGGACFRWHK